MMKSSVEALFSLLMTPSETEVVAFNSLSPSRKLVVQQEEKRALAAALSEDRTFLYFSFSRTDPTDFDFSLHCLQEFPNLLV